MTSVIAEHILTADASERRFEQFCVGLLTEVDGLQYVTTSKTWDMGTDGRDLPAKSGKKPSVICSSLTRTRSAEEKALKDLDRLISAMSPESATFCFVQKLSDATIAKIEKSLRDKAPKIAVVRVLGVAQLAELSARFPSSLEKYYPGELRDLRAALSYESDNDTEIELSGLRIALTTQMSSTAQELRRNTARVIALTALSSSKGATLGALSKRVSDRLHLRAVLREEFIVTALEEGRAAGLVARTGDEFRLTEAGAREVRGYTEAGSGTLIEGRSLLREAIVRRSGHVLSDNEYDRVWNIVQDCLSQVFYANGNQVIDAVANVLQGARPSGKSPSVAELFINLREKIEGLSFAQAKADELAQAIQDALSHEGSELLPWLTRLCSVYVSMCSMGLESRGQEQILKRLREISLVLDSDVVLSLLSEGEPVHQATQALVRGWRRVGGPVYVTDSVLHEVVHHAWISPQDYRETWRSLPTMTDDAAETLIENVFVRGYRKAAKGKYSDKRWRAYIGNFRGTREDDASKIIEVLQEEGIVQAASEMGDEALALRVTGALLKMRQKAAHPDKARDATIRAHKAERDGRVLAFIAAQRQRLAVIGGGTVIMVSSSWRMRAACEVASAELGEPQAVVPIGAIGFMLSLAPEVGLGLDQLRRVLFDVNLGEALRPIERLALRVIHSSSEYEYIGARRASLKRRMRDGLVRMAAARGQKPDEMEAEFVKEPRSHVQEVAELIATSVDERTTPKSEDRIRDLEAKLREVTAELDVEKRRKR